MSQLRLPRRAKAPPHWLPTTTFVAIMYLPSYFIFTNNYNIQSNGRLAPMTAKNPRSGWEKIDNQFYQKIQLYESVFDQDLELENYLVAGAPYGGALGKHRDVTTELS